MGAILVVAYLSATHVPSIKLYDRPDIKQCRDEATAIYKKVKSGTVRAWCVRSIGEQK